jgi:hypothetical protein
MGMDELGSFRSCKQMFSPPWNCHWERLQSIPHTEQHVMIQVIDVLMMILLCTDMMWWSCQRDTKTWPQLLNGWWTLYFKLQCADNVKCLINYVKEMNILLLFFLLVCVCVLIKCIYSYGHMHCFSDHSF